MTILKKIGYIFSKKQKMKFAILLFFIFVGVLLELVGVSAIMPFIQLVMDPGTIKTNKILILLYDILGIESESKFLNVLAICLIILYIIKNVYLGLLYKSQYKYVYSNQKKLSARLLNGYMRQPYVFHLENNTADLVRSVNLDTANFFEIVLAFIQLATEILIATALCLFLLFSDTTMTIILIGFVGMFMLIFFKLFSGKTRRYGEKNQFFSGKMIKSLNQALGGVKEIKVLKREPFFVKEYEEYYENRSYNQIKYMVLAQIPKLFIETICIAGILLTICIKLYLGVDKVAFVSQLAVFAMAAFRLLPSINKINTNLNSIIFGKTYVDTIYMDIRNAEIYEDSEKSLEQNSEISLNKEIFIDNVSYKYPNSDKYVLKNVSFSIPSGKTVALIGTSGAGKTTIADIILGILKPEKGTIKVDGVDVFKNLSRWSEKLGYIPQFIYLSDDTIQNNIAFGIEENLIDIKKIDSAIKQAQLGEFVNSLEKGVNTVVGERGARISGGQRQRIGIARALYHNPELLILDEATSALDNETEKAVMESIDNLRGKKTIIIIAHRLSTIENSDIVFEVNNQNIVRKK